MRSYRASMAEVDTLAKAMVSKQTFYNHFNDKVTLAREIYLSLRDQIEAEVAEANEGVTDPAMRVAHGICVYVRAALRNPDQIRFITRLLIHDIGVTDPANRGLCEDLEAGLKTGRFIVRTIETAAAFVLGATDPLLLSVVEPGNRAAAINLTQEFLTLILRGLSVSPLDAELIAAQAANKLIRPG